MGTSSTVLCVPSGDVLLFQSGHFTVCRGTLLSPQLDTSVLEGSLSWHVILHLIHCRGHWQEDYAAQDSGDITLLENSVPSMQADSCLKRASRELLSCGGWSMAHWPQPSHC